jgi:hypothetical protein
MGINYFHKSLVAIFPVFNIFSALKNFQQIRDHKGSFQI